MMDFMIAGKQGFIRIELTEVYGFPEETSYLGGFGVQGSIEIKSGNYYVKDAELWFSTGQVYEFFVQLQKAYQSLKGRVIFMESDNNLDLSLHFNQFGQINIKGNFQEVSEPENSLQFEFESEQSYLVSTLQQLQRIVDYYGD
ncbi:MAG: hypothetical protein WBF39_03740 [Planococcus donghaensis]